MMRSIGFGSLCVTNFPFLKIRNYWKLWGTLGGLVRPRFNFLRYWNIFLVHPVCLIYLLEWNLPMATEKSFTICKNASCSKIICRTEYQIRWSQKTCLKTQKGGCPRIKLILRKTSFSKLLLRLGTRVPWFLYPRSSKPVVFIDDHVSFELSQ